MTDFKDRIESFLTSSDNLSRRHVHPRMLKMFELGGMNKAFVRAEGQYLWDAEGERYLDFLAGGGVYFLGRNHPKVNGALIDILSMNLPNLCVVNASVLGGMVAEKLLQHGGPQFTKVVFANAGSEATEVALRFARQVTRRRRFLYVEGAFHGRSYGAISVCGFEAMRKGDRPRDADLHPGQAGRHRPAPPRAEDGRRGRLHLRAGPGHDRRAARRGVPPRSREPLRAARHRADRRRDPDRPRPHRLVVRDPRDGRPPAHHDRVEDPVRRPDPGRCGPRQREHLRPDLQRVRHRPRVLLDVRREQHGDGLGPRDPRGARGDRRPGRSGLEGRSPDAGPEGHGDPLRRDRPGRREGPDDHRPLQGQRQPDAPRAAEGRSPRPIRGRSPPRSTSTSSSARRSSPRSRAPG